MANAKNFWNDTSGHPISCDGASTSYSLSGALAIAALGLKPDSVIRYNGKDEFGGYNQVTVVVTGLGGGRTWGFEANVGGAWITLASGLATDVNVVTHGVGPQVGIHNSTTPAFRAFPAFRATDYRVTTSAADATGKIYFIAESFPC